MQLVLYWSVEKKEIPCGGEIQAMIDTKIYQELQVHWAQVWLNLFRDSLGCCEKQHKEIGYIHVNLFCLVNGFGNVCL